MKACVFSLTILLCVIGSSVFPGRTTTDPLPAIPAAGDSLLDLVAATALAAVEIRGLCDGIGERGWLFLIKGEQAGSVSAVALIETRPAPALEETLADLLDWAGEQAWVHSLGALLPHCWIGAERGTATRGMGLWTPFGKRTGFAFALAGEYLVLANSEAASRTELEVAGHQPDTPGPYLQFPKSVRMTWRDADQTWKLEIRPPSGQLERYLRSEAAPGR